MNEARNMENTGCPVRPMNIKERMLTITEMQYKALEIVSAIKHDISGVENENKPVPVCNCMEDEVSQQLERMDTILNELCYIKDALGVVV